MRAEAIVIMAAFALSCAMGSRPMSQSEREMKIDQLLSDYRGAAPGAAVLVIHDGSVAVRTGYGMADLEAGLPVSPTTNFRLASVTKQFTATAIQILEGQDLLSYEDSIRRHLPVLPPYAEGITVRHVLTHTSGLPDYEDLISGDATEQVYDRDVLRLIEATEEGLFEPGSAYQYSNTGYALLSLIVEAVSGESFATFLHRNIFAPLGMQHSLAHVEGVSRISDRAYGYVRNEGQWTRKDQSITSAVLGDGGIYSNVDDLIRWDHALTHATVVSHAALEAAMTPAVDTGVPGIAYGFGWRVSEHRGHRQIWHSGETSGFRNVMVRFPDARLTVIVLTNRNDTPPYDMALEISDLYLPR